MTNTTKIKVAALVTALFIGGLTAAGIGLRSSPASETPAAPAAAATTPPQHPDSTGASRVQAQAPQELDDHDYESDDEYGVDDDDEREDEAEHGAESEDD
jgi:hypothetical protein